MMHPSEVVAPNPFEPVIRLQLSSTPAKSYHDYSSTFRRRAEILASTRLVLSREGAEGFTVKSVSKLCEVSPQTIHNSFGQKSKLLLAALNQHALIVDSTAYSHLQDPTFFLALAVIYQQSAMQWPDFMREHLRLTFSPKDALRPSLVRFGIKLKQQVVRKFQQDGLLRPLIEPQIVAEQVAWAISVSLWEWAENDDLGQLWVQLSQGIAMTILGALAPDTSESRAFEKAFAELVKPPAWIALFPAAIPAKFDV